MCPSNLTWLLKISVKLSIFIHRNSYYKWALIFTKGWCVSFLRKVVFYLERFVVLKDMLSAQTNNTKKSHFPGGKVTRLVGWDLDTTLAYLGHQFAILLVSVFVLLSFGKEARLCNLFITQIRCRNPWIVVLLQKKVAAQKLWRGNGRLRKITQNKYSLQRYGTMEGSPEVGGTKKSLNKEEFSTKNEKRHSPGYSLISLNKQWRF